MLSMPMPKEEIETRIRAALPEAEITLVALANDDDHWEVTVVAPEFEGKSRVQQHQMVYAALGSDMGTTLHALSVKTKAA